MNEEKTLLHNQLVATLKNEATESYNLFLSAYEKLGEDKEGSKKKFISLVSKGDYIISSLSFYDEMLNGFDRSEDYLYIAQLLSLLIKASHNMIVVYNEESYKEKKAHYIELIDKYYELGKNLPKIGEILLAFKKDAALLK